MAATRTDVLYCDDLVIGSGPGGANTACLLARAGRDVLLVEEGDHWRLKDVPSYSFSEMKLKYRHGGLTPAFGKPRIVYIEPCCVGGASEINAGLFHEPDPEILDEWSQLYGIRDLTEKALLKYIDEYKKEVSVSTLPDGAGPASTLIQDGARRLKWQVKELPRFWKYTRDTAGQWQGARQSMTETLIPALLKARGRLLAGTRVQRIAFKGRTARSVLAEARDESGRRKPLRIHFRNIFVCGGAVQTPLLLRQSGITKNIGNTLSMHPAVRVAARFTVPVHDPDEGVPVVQVNEFKPGITLGGSYSGLPHLGLWMAGRETIEEELADSGKMALFYVLIRAQGQGRVRPLPVSQTPFVSLGLTGRDLQCFGEGLYRLGSLLFAAGAQKIYSPLKTNGDFQSLRSMEPLKDGLSGVGVDITTIHLFSSCPLGETLNRCAVNSYGRLHGYNNVYLNDASILPGPPGINPQGLIMALARRNVRHFLDKQHS